MSELTELTGSDLADLLRSREVSAREAVAAHLDRIEQLDVVVNAICTRAAEAALRAADEADLLAASGQPLPALHGVPIVHKDLLDTAGLRTTYGSEAFADYVPATDALIVSRCRAAGAIALGKSNTPQFGTGGHTWNRLFGTTRNPWNPELSAGGSSGGSAAALAAGMTPLATGTDMAGSLRIPASFCGVVGLRPSPGRIPYVPTDLAWFPYVVAGPMARTVGDVALLLAVVAGPDASAAISLEDGLGGLATEVDTEVSGWRVAWAPGIAGLPVAEEVRQVLAGVLPAVLDLGVEVRDGEPDLAGAEEAFLTWRAWYYATRFSELYRERRAILDEATVANIEQGMRLTGTELGRAERLRSALHSQVAAFFQEVDILLMPATPIGAFSADMLWPDEIDGEMLSSYLSWMRHLYYITATTLPSLSLPAGVTASGSPVGVQVVAGPRQDRRLLQFARALERSLGHCGGSVAPVAVR